MKHERSTFFSFPYNYNYTFFVKSIYKLTFSGFLQENRGYFILLMFRNFKSSWFTFKGVINRNDVILRFVYTKEEILINYKHVQILLA